MFTSGMGVSLSAEQQYLYGKPYDDYISLSKHGNFLQFSPDSTSPGLPFLDSSGDGFLLNELVGQAGMSQLSQLLLVNPNKAEPESVTNNAVFAGKPSFFSTHKNKTVKKDRHSKIFTAHGPRDRRMRLSRDVARKFFDLQDLLRFDKGSKTVEWLMIQSKAAIRELTKAKDFSQNNHSSSGKTGSAGSYSVWTSAHDCEVVSGIDEMIPESNTDRDGNSKEKLSKEKKVKHSRKANFHPLARETRANARARARERTRWKKSLGESNLTSASPLETPEESANKTVSSHSMEHHDPIQDFVEDSFHSFFDCNEHVPVTSVDMDDLISNSNNAIKLFPENWDTDPGRTHFNSSAFIIPHLHLPTENVQDRLLNPSFLSAPSTQFTDFQFCSRL